MTYIRSEMRGGCMKLIVSCYFLLQLFLLFELVVDLVRVDAEVILSDRNNIISNQTAEQFTSLI